MNFSFRRTDVKRAKTKKDFNILKDIATGRLYRKYFIKILLFNLDSIKSRNICIFEKCTLTVIRSNVYLVPTNSRLLHDDNRVDSIYICFGVWNCMLA